jgi:hypothetical protein
MKRLTLAALVGGFALLGTVAAAAGAPSPAQQCRTERSGMGVELFRQTYGTNKNRHNAFGRCVSKRARATDRASADAERNASQACSGEEQADPAAFAEKYGTGKKKRNAHGKCVAQKAQADAAQTVHEQVEADVNAAKTCREERKADPEAFRAQYGTNKNKRNAFGKCVSQRAHEANGS